MKQISKISMLFLIFGLFFLYIPIFFLVFYSFNESPIAGVWTNFSMKWFAAVFNDAEFMMVAATSIEIAIISATGATILGLIAAIATTGQGSFVGKKLLTKLIPIPIIMPEIIIGFSLLMLFTTIEKLFGISIKRGIATITIGHVMASMAYVHMTISARLANFEQSLEEAAQNLGASPINAFLYVTIPVVSKSIFSGWLLAFTLSLDDLVIASFLSGPGSTTLPILIFSNIRIGLAPTINAFSTMFIGVIAICIILAWIISQRKRVTQTNQF
jgi:putrescine transport system permease protein